MTVFGERLHAVFARRQAQARKPRFLEIARDAEWKHMPDVKATFRATDFDPNAQLYIFDIGGNKYRLRAGVTFEAQSLLIEAIVTCGEHNRNG